MDLKRRLARLERSGGKAPADAVATSSILADPPDSLELERRPGAAGAVWVRNGVFDVAPPAPAPPALADALTREVPDDLDWSEVLFLDTETTGLAGGTGTVPFVVGLGWWEDDRLVTEQYLLPSPGAEAAMLAAVAERAASFRVVATYNGHAYDLPLLRTRGVLARRRDMLAGLASWDLLPAARRLWGRRLPDCRQGTVEAVLAPSGRESDDIPGSEIPRTWLDWVRRGEGGGLDPVLRHNAWDLAGMAVIVDRAVAACTRLITGPEADVPAPDWRDAWSFARLAEFRRRREIEAAWATVAAAGSPDALGEIDPESAPPERFYIDVVRLLKRTAAWPEVAILLGRGLRHHPGSEHLHREAAILYEHRLVDGRRALRHARRSGETSRVQRLERRLGIAPGAEGS